MIIHIGFALSAYRVCVANILMRFFLLSPLCVMGFDFSGLLGRIQSETMRFDRQTDEYRNKEEAGIRAVELRERDIDRSLDGIKMRLHLDSSPNGASFLQRHMRKHHSKPIEANLVTSESDEKELEKLEMNREAAEDKFISVEENIAEMPERIMHTKEKHAKEDFEVPLDDEYTDADEA